MNKSGIVWTDQTWSPVTGCSKVSVGCKNCYAEREVETRWSKNPKSVFFGRKFTDVQTHYEKLEEPLRWKKGRRIFVCPRGDLFHEAVQDSFIDKVFAVMALCPQHIFQVLTKRPARMLNYLTGPDVVDRWCSIAKGLPELARRKKIIDPMAWGSSLRNVWIGVSVENQPAAAERIPLLLKTPAAVRWVSVEPMLGAVDLTRIEHPCYNILTDVLSGCDSRAPCDSGTLDWVVCGGESGSNARPMHPDWVRSLRDQCAAGGVPFLFKQWDGTKAAGRLLDGVLHDGYPVVQP